MGRYRTIATRGDCAPLCQATHRNERRLLKTTPQLSPNLSDDCLTILVTRCRQQLPTMISATSASSPSHTPPTTPTPQPSESPADTSPEPCKAFPVHIDKACHSRTWPTAPARDHAASEAHGLPPPSPCRSIWPSRCRMLSARQRVCRPAP